MRRRILESAYPVLCLLFAITGASPTAEAALPADIEKGLAVETLPQASKHWVWVNDLVFPHMADGAALLIDGDSGKFLGTLSTGFGFMHVLLPHDGKLIYSPETYFSRGNRGTRTDVVSIYDAKTLSPVGEIAIPPKRSANLPMMANNVLTDDDRFLLIYNFNPAQSLTIVDVNARKMASEVETPGCALAYPTGPRSFFSVCGDGSLALGRIDETGKASIARSEPIFALGRDPVTEKAVRRGNTWFFVTYEGLIYPVTVQGGKAGKGATWWLTSAEERKQGWRPGGLQQLAIDADARLYAIMHMGGPYTHQDPGKDVWVYDTRTHQRLMQVGLHELASSIQVSSDAEPLLFTVSPDRPALDIYGAHDGRFLRTVDQVGTTPMLLVTP